MNRILIWSPNYAPEPTGIPPLVTDAAEWLVDRCHSVDVITAVPNYPSRRIDPEYRDVLWRSERRNGVCVHRSWLWARPERTFLDKALYEASISTFALPNAIRYIRRADVVVCVVPTLFAATYAATLVRVYKKRLVLWIQDLVLSAAPSVGVGAVASRILSAAQRLEQRAVRASDKVIVCSPGFRDYLVAQGADAEKIETIYNWADTDWIAPVERHVNGGPVRFLYAGNLGYTQGLETLIDAARIGGDGIVVDIVGAGNASEIVKKHAASVQQVTVRPPVERDKYPVLLGSADVHLVVQRRVSAGANLPSKIATYMASGRPVLASIDNETSAADLLRESGAAILVKPESPRALASAMRTLAQDTDLRTELGAKARMYAEQRFAKKSALQSLETAIFR